MIDYKILSKDEFLPLFKVNRPIVFPDSTSIDLESLYSEEENDQTKKLHTSFFSNEYRLNITAWDEDKLIGWSCGFAKSAEEFYMLNSGVLEEYRRQKVYSELMKQVIEKVVSDGFKEITSKHHADNNAVIIPKLKAGFTIRGFEISPRHGLLVNLVMYSNTVILSVHNQRVGSKNLKDTKLA